MIADRALAVNKIVEHVESNTLIIIYANVKIMLIRRARDFIKCQLISWREIAQAFHAI